MLGLLSYFGVSLDKHCTSHNELRNVYLYISLTIVSLLRLRFLCRFIYLYASVKTVETSTGNC
jgi:hypothetical protein